MNLVADQPRILALAGSLRSDSFNRKLVKLGAAAARAAGADVTDLDLRDFPLPIFDEDLERKEGLPGNAALLKAMFKAHQGLLIASPEYNSSLTAALKNAIDWASRPAPGERPLECFADRVAALMSASPGALGGLRGLVHLRAILGNIQVLVLPEQIAISKAHEAFAADGSLKDSKQQEIVERIARKLVQVVRKLHS